MAVRRLHNDDWGFESNCFVCEDRNRDGLRIPFDHDDEANRVRARFNLDDRFSGAPKYVHGGMVLAILDEAMAWATIAVAGKFAVTRTTSATFERPVKVGRDYRVEARVATVDDTAIATCAHVEDEQSRRCVEADATFVVLSPAMARSAIGEVGERHARRLRDGTP